MYNDTTYLTVMILRELTAISNNTSIELLEPFILPSEQQHIIPIIGTALDTELKEYLDNDNLSGDSETLVINYIIPASAWMCWKEASVFLSYKSHNKGIVKQSSESSEPIDLDELKLYQQRIFQTGVFYMKRLKDYLNDNSDKYSNYRNNDCSTQPNPNSSGFFLG